MCIAFDQAKGILLFQMKISLDILMILFQTDIDGTEVIHFQMKHQTQLLRILLHFILFGIDVEISVRILVLQLQRKLHIGKCLV